MLHRVDELLEVMETRFLVLNKLSQQLGHVFLDREEGVDVPG